MQRHVDEPAAHERSPAAKPRYKALKPIRYSDQPPYDGRFASIELCSPELVRAGMGPGKCELTDANVKGGIHVGQLPAYESGIEWSFRPEYLNAGPSRHVAVAGRTLPCPRKARHAHRSPGSSAAQSAQGRRCRSCRGDLSSRHRETSHHGLERNGGGDRPGHEAWQNRISLPRACPPARRIRQGRAPGRGDVRRGAAPLGLARSETKANLCAGRSRIL